MKYYPKGWNKFKFLIDPVEFEYIFSKFHHIEFSNRVPENYIETDKQKLLNNYKTFYEKLILNYKFNKNELFGFFIGLSDDLAKCTYGKSFLDEKNNKKYKLSDFKEPCVGISPFIFLLKDNKLNTNFYFNQYPENVMGLEISYPKEIIYYDNNVENKIKNCNELETYNNVYKKIIEEIKNIAKALKFNISDKEYRTNVKISKKIKIGNVYFIKQNNCILK
jgi:hypothetical protein